MTISRRSAEHTPGPWKGIPFDDCQSVIIPDRDDDRQALICTVSIGEGRPDGEANARLIAAAPALLAACKWVLREIEWGHDMRASERILNQTIEKAQSTVSQAEKGE